MILSKLRRLNHQIRPTHMRMDNDTMMNLSVRMPGDSVSLSEHITGAQMKAFGDQVLSLIQAHPRDSEKFKDCVAEMRAFATGGEYAMDVLGKVYGNILRHFDMEKEKEEIMAAVGVYEKEGKLLLRGKRDFVSSQ
jgi:hypothetical protein